MKHTCSNCARSTKTSGQAEYARFICEDGRNVERKGTCDRWTHVIQDREFYQRVRESLKRMEPYQEGTYQIRRLPPVGTNYRVED